MANTSSGAASGAKAGAALGSVVPGVGTVIGGAVGTIIGGIAGFFGGRSQKKKAEELLRQANAEIDAVGAPPEMAREIILQKFKQEGMYSPELEQEVDLAASKIAQIQEAPELRDAQMQALRSIQQRASGGLTPEDRALFEKMRSGVRSDTRGKERQIISELAQRGQAGAGAELAARLQASQSGADQASQQGMDIAAAASRNALEAAAQSGNLSGNIRSQDFGVNQARAAAEDERNRMLFQNSTALRSRNVEAQNIAQRANLAMRQRLSEANIGQANDETTRQRYAQLQDYNNRLKLAQDKADRLTGQAGYAANKGNKQSADLQRGIGGAYETGRDIYNALSNRQPTEDNNATDENGNIQLLAPLKPKRKPLPFAGGDSSGYGNLA